jgi:peptide/nickel transport system ATP-binding protein
MTSLLRVLELRVDFVAREGKRTHALNGANFEMRRGEILGVLGESGSGKSTVARATLQLQRSAGRSAFHRDTLRELHPWTSQSAFHSHG